MSKQVLVVDDSVSIRQMVEMTLKGAGYGVTTAQDGHIPYNHPLMENPIQRHQWTTLLDPWILK